MSGTLIHLSESRSAITESKKAIASLTSELDCGPFLSMDTCWTDGGGGEELAKG